MSLILTKFIIGFVLSSASFFIVKNLVKSNLNYFSIKSMTSIILISGVIIL